MQVRDSRTEALEPVHLQEPVVRVRRLTPRLLLAAAAMGGVGALAAALVRLSFRGLQWLLTGSSADPPLAAEHLGPLRRAMTPVLGALLGTIVLLIRSCLQRQAGKSKARDVEYVEAVRHRGGWLALGPNCWRTGAAAFSVASGAAVGREGSMIQFAAAVTSLCGRWRGWSTGDSPREGQGASRQLGLLVAFGVAGGVTAAYNAPLAAVFFAAEIVLGGLDAAELGLLAVAAGVGWAVSGMLLGRARLYPAQAFPLSAAQWVLLPILAVGAGVCGPAYQWLLGSLRRLRRLPFALLWGGAVVGGLSLVDPRVWGNGDLGLRAALGTSTGTGFPAHAVGSILLLRTAATLSCVWTGTIGGVFTPTLFTGAALGGLAGQVLGPSVGLPSPTLPAMVAMGCFLAATTHAPLMAACMVAELTGDWALLPVLIPLNLLSVALARRISPKAMYAIASQAPAHNRGMSSGKGER